MKKVIIWFLIILIVVVCLRYIGLPLLIDYTFLWQLSANYEEYAEDFNAVKDYIESQYPGESNKCLSVSYVSGLKLYDQDTQAYLQLPENIFSSLETICKYGFPNKDAYLDKIRTHGDNVSFCTGNGGYALVFSPNEKPSKASSPAYYDYEVKVKSLGNGWYHVMPDPG